MKSNLLTILFVMATYVAFSQSPVISGKVIRAENGEAMVGANVSIKGTTRGTITDVNGRFQLRSNINVGSITLVAKFIGFKEQEKTINITGVNKIIDFELVSNDNQLQDVVVSANKTEEFLQKVSVAATVVSSRDMEQRSSYSTLEAMKDAPLLLTDSWITSQTSFSIRGLSNNFDNVGFENTVGLYLDDVYYSRPYIFNSTLFDIERIEILRGPQGTLFGKNTIGGVINLISEKPEWANNGQVEIVGGNYGYFQFRGKWNQELIKNKLSLRLTGATTRRDGYIPDPNPTINKQNGQAFYGLRGSLFYKHNDKTDASLKFFYGRDDKAEQTMIYTSKPDFDPIGIPATGLDNTETNVPQSFWRNQMGTTLKISHKHKNDNLTSITAFNSSEDEMAQDWDLTKLDLTRFGRRQGVDAFSQEFRINSPRDQKLAYVAGVYYLYEKIKGRDTTTVNQDVFDFAEEVTGEKYPRIKGFEESTTTNSVIQSNSISAFGSGSYELNDKAKINVGLRLTHERRTLDFYQTANYYIYQGKPVGIIDIYGSEVASEENPIVAKTVNNVITYDLGLDYKISPFAMSYVKFSRGFKGAGFNTTVVYDDKEESLVFKPEYVNSFETGLKSKFSNRIRLNAAVFYTDYINKQEYLDEGTTVKILNANKAGGFGAEVEFSAMLKGFRLDASAGLLNLKYQDFIFGEDINGKPIDLSGKKLLKAPSTTLSLSPTYTFNLFDKYRLLAALNMTHTGKSYNDITNSEVIARRPLSLINSRLSLMPKNGKWSFALWGKNLTNQIYYQHGWEYDYGDQVSVGRPRTFGFEVYLNFN